MFNAGRQLGGAVGVAMLSTIISAVGVMHHVGNSEVPNAAAYHWAFLAASLVALFTAVLAQQVDDREAAPTMRRAPKPEPYAELPKPAMSEA